MKAINTQSNFKTINFQATRMDSLYYILYKVIELKEMEWRTYCRFFNLVLFGGGMCVSETKLNDYAEKFVSGWKFFN